MPITPRAKALRDSAVRITGLSPWDFRVRTTGRNGGSAVTLEPRNDRARHAILAAAEELSDDCNCIVLVAPHSNFAWATAPESTEEGGHGQVINLEDKSRESEKLRKIQRLLAS